MASKSATTLRSRGSPKSGAKSPRIPTRPTKKEKDKHKEKEKFKIVDPSQLPELRLSPTMFLTASDMKPSPRTNAIDTDLQLKLDTYIDIEKLGGRHLMPIRPVTARTEREGIATLKIRQLNTGGLDALEGVAYDLKRLDFSKTGITCLPNTLVTHLGNLRKLVLNFNKLTENSFPDSFNGLFMLRELSVAYNELKSIPKAWFKLRHLVRLNVEGNKLEDLTGIGNFKRLTVLVIDRNELTELPKEIGALRRLEGLFAKRNRIRTLNTYLKYLRHLHVLNVSENVIENVSADVFSLPHLEFLCLSRNNISRLPIFNIQAFQGRRVASIDLAENRLTRLPEHILRISERLDLSYNRIRTLTGNILKKFDKTTEQVLDLHGNSTLIPPPEICEAGLRSIVRYFCDEDVQEQVYQGVKVYVLGATGSGKTSLIRTLIDQQPLPAEPDEHTQGINVLETIMEIQQPFSKLLPENDNGQTLTVLDAPNVAATNLIASPKLVEAPNSVLPVPNANATSNQDSSVSSLKLGQVDLQGVKSPIRSIAHSRVNSRSASPEPTSVSKSAVVNFWEFGGNSEMLHLYTHFLRDPALVVIVFDPTSYTTENYQEAIGVWLDFAFIRFFKAHILLVASHQDQIKVKKLKSVCAQVYQDVLTHFIDKRNRIERDIAGIEGSGTISTTLSEYYTHVLRLKELEITMVAESVLTTSAETYEGYKELAECLHNCFYSTTALYPTALKAFPVKFAEIETYVEDLAEKSPLLELERYTKLIGLKYGLHPSKATEVAAYMNLCGKVMWTNEDKFYGDFLILKPQVLSEALLTLFNFKQILVHTSQNDEPGFSPLTPISPYDAAFEDLTVEHFVQFGLVNLSFLTFLWTRLVPILKEEQVFMVAQLVFDRFELGISADKVAHEDVTPHIDDTSSAGAGTRPTTARSDKTTASKYSEVPPGRFPAALDDFGLRIFVPALSAPPHASLLSELQELDAEPLQICGVYQIFDFMAPLVFERVCGRIHKTGAAAHRVWNGGILVKHLDHDYVAVRIEKDEAADGKPACIKFTAVSLYKISIAKMQAAAQKNEKLKPISNNQSSSSSRRNSRPSSTQPEMIERKISTQSTPNPQKLQQALLETQQSDISINLTEDSNNNEPEKSDNNGIEIDVPSDKSIADKMWHVVLPIMKELDDMLPEYPGLWYRRMLRCPFCREVSFNAEWASRDFHEENEMICKACNAGVPLYLLVQPREKRKIEDIAKLRQQMKDKRLKEQENARSSSASYSAKQKARSAKRY